MNKGLSIWLDVLRCAAALAVLFGHLAHVRFTNGDFYVLREINIASDAVVVFFVISGLVIAFAADRDGTPGIYAFNRITRLLSVVIPALILTVILDAIGTQITPSAYPAPYYQPASYTDFLLRGVTLSTEWTGLFDRIRLGTNGPLWSLSYEVAYYILFGIAVFCRGIARVLGLGLVALIVGWPILALFPAWLLGVLVWRHVSTTPTDAINPIFAWSLVFVPAVLLIAARRAGIPDILTELTAAAVAPASHHVMLGYSDEVLWNSLIALAVALHLAGIASVLRGRAFDMHTPRVRAIRWFAGGTFSIYAVHYPILHFLDAVLPADTPFYNFKMAVLTLAACFCFAHLFERPIKAFRGFFVKVHIGRMLRASLRQKNWNKSVDFEPM
ncbi:MAG: acyltransferase [Rhodobacter sp.]|nr:acyltransferase [Rhodobacter sp.]